MAVKELIEQDSYTLYPRYGNVCGVERIVLNCNPVKKTVDMMTYFNKQRVNSNITNFSLTQTEAKHLQQHINRLSHYMGLK